jgi:hypothetical protein
MGGSSATFATGISSGSALLHHQHQSVSHPPVESFQSGYPFGSENPDGVVVESTVRRPEFSSVPGY